MKYPHFEEIGLRLRVVIPCDEGGASQFAIPSQHKSMSRRSLRQRMIGDR